MYKIYKHTVVKNSKLRLALRFGLASCLSHLGLMKYCHTVGHKTSHDRTTTLAYFARMPMQRKKFYSTDPRPFFVKFGSI